MAGVYSEFLSSLNRYGVSKTSHFRLSVPGFKNPNWADIDKLLGLRCEATELPGRQVVSNDSRTYGPTYKTPYQSLYQEITLNFIETSNFVIRGFFERWMSSIFNPSTNILSYPSVYRVDTALTQYDVTIRGGVKKSNPQPDIGNESLETVAVWQMYNSFPTAINQMPVSWAEDGLHRVTVTLSFEWYTLLTGEAAQTNPQSKVNSPPVPPKGSARQ